MCPSDEFSPNLVTLILTPTYKVVFESTFTKKLIAVNGCLKIVLNCFGLVTIEPETSISKQLSRPIDPKFTYIVSLESFLIGGHSTRVLLIIPNGSQVVLGLLGLLILEEPDNSHVVVLDEVGDLQMVHLEYEKQSLSHGAL